LNLTDGGLRGDYVRRRKKWGSEIAAKDNMELVMDDKKIKEMLSEALVEIIVKKSELLRRLIIDAIEEIGLITAIREGRRDDFVGEETIMELLGS